MVACAVVKLARDVPELEGLVVGVEGLLVVLELRVDEDNMARAAVKVAREVPELEEGLLVGVECLLVTLELLVEEEIKVARAVSVVVDLLVGVEGLLVDLVLIEDEGRLSPFFWFLDDMLSLSSSRQFSSCSN